jgi:hypothetical protein
LNFGFAAEWPYATSRLDSMESAEREIPAFYEPSAMIEGRIAVALAG